MSTTRAYQVGTSSVCAVCGTPVDAQYFDQSGVKRLPEPGRNEVLARFELPPQYCGTLEYFSQFWEPCAKHPEQVHTPGVEWVILSNGRPLYPYLPLDRVVNPWGYGSFPVGIRLEENATIEFVVRNVSRVVDDDPKKREMVGGRLVGRYWYNAVYGDVVRNGR